MLKNQDSFPMSKISRRLLVRISVVSTFVLIPLIYSLRNPSTDPRTGASIVQHTFDNAKSKLREEFSPRQAYEGEKEEMDDAWVDLDDGKPITSFDGGIAGYTVWSNLYLSGGALINVEPDKPGSQHKLKAKPAIRQIMSGEKKPEGGYPAAGEDRWRSVGEDIARGEMGNRALLLKGVTYIFNDEAGPAGYLVFFRHLVMEGFVGATRMLASTLSNLGGAAGFVMETPSRVWFPRCGLRPSWRDDKGENVWFMSHVVPGAVVEDATAWEDRITADVPILLERVVIIDRWAAHSVGGETGKWGKMNAGIVAERAPTSFWDPFRLNAMKSMGVDGPSRIGSRGLPVIVYIDRQKEKPRLEAGDHLSLIEALKSLTPKAEVHVTKLSAMGKAQQIELMSRAEIIISARGDELINTLWMKATPRSAMIELYEEGGFQREFSLLAAGLNHKYFAISGSHVLEEKEWRAIGNKNGPQRDQFPVDPKFIVQVIGEILDGQR